MPLCRSFFFPPKRDVHFSLSLCARSGCNVPSVLGGGAEGGVEPDRRGTAARLSRAASRGAGRGLGRPALAPETGSASIPGSSTVFIMRECSILSGAFSASIKMVTWFLVFILLMWCSKITGFLNINLIFCNLTNFYIICIVFRFL